MFHGPRFQGISELSAVGERHVRGVFTTPDAPGGLLDNVGQLFGHWIVETQTVRRVVFPVAIGEVRWYGPEPAPGARVGCELRVRSITDTTYEFDAQLTGETGVLADVTGWQDHRFDSHPDTEPTYRFPERNGLSRPQPGGWSLTVERWASVASRDLYLRKYLNAAEQADHDRLSPPVRRHWTLGRIAVKDAVRARLWQQGWGPVFPAEILVRNDAAGRPVVAGHHGLALPEFAVSIAHSGELGVALAREGTANGVGIDIEQVTERPEATHTVALSATERELLAGLVAASGEPAALWFTRFWTAKESVAKAEGTGLGGEPRRFAVTAATDEELTVAVAGRVYRVRCASVRNPDDLTERDYVVAWTTDTGEGEES
jgi:phosphopantetheinyl transferase